MRDLQLTDRNIYCHFFIELLIFILLKNKIIKRKQSCGNRNADNKWNALAAHANVVVFKLCELGETVFWRQ